MKERLYFLDNLRTVMIFLVVVVHAGLVYESVLENTWIVVDPAKNNSIGLIRMYLDLFIMFVIFFVSGYFVPISLQKKGSLEFIKSKIKRILIPWILAVLTLIPAYKCIFLYARGLPQEEWYTYFHWFERTGTDPSFFANYPTQSWLWFLPVLFLFQLLYMCLAKLKLLAFRMSLKTGVILTLVLGTLYGLLISNLELSGWYHSTLFHFQRERLLIYFMAFLLGSLSYKLQVFEGKAKNKKHYILSNVLLSLSLSVYTVVALNLFFNMIDPTRNYFFVSDFVDHFFYYISAMLSMLSFLYLFIHIFRVNFNASKGIMKVLNSNSYSVYIIHMIVLGLLAMLLLNWGAPAMIKMLVLCLLSFIVSNILVSIYDRLSYRMPLTVTGLSTMFLLLIALSNSTKCQDPDRDQILSIEQLAVQKEPKVGLHMAAIQGNVEAIRKHIKAGADLDIREPSGGSSPLITAAVFGQTEIAILLIEAGANVNFKNNEGSTPLHTAAFFGHVKIVEILLDHGADKSILNTHGSTALNSVLAPFESVKGIYDYFGNTLGPLGLKLDYDYIIRNRSLIANLLQE
jgi:fucose 4-O-acetylase-like acetyltransferase